MKSGGRVRAKRLALCLLAVLAAGAGHAAVAAEREEKAVSKPSRLIVDIDVNDEVIGRSHPMTDRDIRDLVATLKDNGCDTLLVRMGFLGILPYRTELGYPMRFDEEDARRTAAESPDMKDLEPLIARNLSWIGRYAEMIRNVNPPAAFIQHGHELGLKVIIWLDIFDDGVPGFRSKFLEENPRCHWTARDGKTHFRGLMSYAWPEARAFRVAQAKELLDLGADGIHCSTSAHSRHLRSVQEADFYGFEQPVVDEYRRRFGVDIRTAEDFDRDAWHDIKGDMMVQLYRDLADLCHGRGKELWIGLQLGKHTHLSANPYFGTNVVARYSNHWKRLVDERIADAIIVGDYELMSSGKKDPYWQAKTDVAPREGEDLYGWAAREYLPYCAGKTKVFLFGEWLGGSPKDLDDKFATWAERVTRNNFDGIDIHEAANVESPDYAPTLKRLSQRLRGTDLGPF